MIIATLARFTTGLRLTSSIQAMDSPHQREHRVLGGSFRVFGLLVAAVCLALTATAQSKLPGVLGAVTGVAVGDIDGDRHLDIVYAIDGAEPRAYRNVAGEFRLIKDAFNLAKFAARDLVLTDVDGDGDLDLVLACYRQINRILLNDGTGKFRTVVDLVGQPNAWTRAVDAADLDGDGQMDLVFASMDSGVHLWLQTSRKVWLYSPAMAPRSSHRSTCLAIGDVDGDGDLDVVCGNRPNALKSGGADEVLLNNGKGLLVRDSKRHALGRFNTTGLVLGDTNRDGTLDLLAAHTGPRDKIGARNTIHLFKSRFGSGSKSRMVADDARTNAVALGDVDGDGDLDAVFANNGQNALLINDGQGRFVEARFGSLPQDQADSRDVKLADLDQDGDLDIVVANWLAVSDILFNDGSGHFTAISLNESPDSAAVEDPFVGTLTESAIRDLILKLGNDDDATRARATEALALAGARVLPRLIASIDTAPKNIQQIRRSRSAARAIKLMGRGALSVATELVDLLRDSRRLKPDSVGDPLVLGLIEALGELYPYFDPESSGARQALLELMPDYYESLEVARAWSRMEFTRTASIDRLLSAVRDSNPFVRELALELYSQRVDRDAAHLGELDRGFRANGRRVPLNLPNSLLEPETVVDDVLWINDRLAKLVLELDPESAEAHTHRIMRGGQRWDQKKASSKLWTLATASIGAATLDADGRWAIPSIELILRTAQPSRLDLLRERQLIVAALRALGAIQPPSASARWLVDDFTRYAQVEKVARETLDLLPESNSTVHLETPWVIPVVYRDRARRRRGADVKSTRAIRTGLSWLASCQDGDGRWDCDEFMKHLPAGCDGEGAAVHDIGVTGLATLCFLGEGNSHVKGEFAKQISLAVEWLGTQQDDKSGLLGTNNSNEFIYNHAIGTLAIAEAWGLSGDPRLKPVVQRAARYLMRHKNPNGVWRYQPRDSDNDTSVTSWCAMALMAVNDAGITVPENELRVIRGWYSSMRDPITGRVGYSELGSLSSRVSGEHSSQFPRELSEAMTAAAMFTSMRIGTPVEVLLLAQQERLLLARLPEKGRDRRSYYYWFWGSHAMHQIGGESWSRWKKALAETLLPLQSVRGGASGSWDPTGVWSESGGRIYSTAMAILALQAEYRWSSIVTSSGTPKRR